MTGRPAARAGLMPGMATCHTTPSRCSSRPRSSMWRLQARRYEVIIEDIEHSRKRRRDPGGSSAAAGAAKEISASAGVG